MTLLEVLYGSKVNFSQQYDARTGLGYGKLNPDKQLPRQSQSSFPYVDEDEYVELPDAEFDDDFGEIKFSNKLGRKLSSDPYAANGTNPFYSVGGNTKLSDCFLRPDTVLFEIGVASKSIAAIPSLYKKNFDGGIGGSPGAAFPSGVGNFRRTGSERGFSKAPPPSKAASEIEEPEEFFTLKDFAKIKDENDGNL